MRSLFGTWAQQDEWFTHEKFAWKEGSTSAPGSSNIVDAVQNVLSILSRQVEHLPPHTEQLHVAEEPRLMYAVNAQLAVLPPTLRPKHGPILVVLETWSDGMVVARWPEGRLYGEGTCDADAIRDLAENLAEFVDDIIKIRATHKLAGAALEQWHAVSAMFDILCPDVSS